MGTGTGTSMRRAPRVRAHQPPPRVDEQVARVGVGVEEADVEELGDEARHARRDEPVDRRRRRLGELLALDPFGGEHLARGHGALAARHVDVAAAEARDELAREALGRRLLARARVVVQPAAQDVDAQQPVVRLAERHVAAQVGVPIVGPLEVGLVDRLERNAARGPGPQVSMGEQL